MSWKAYPTAWARHDARRAAARRWQQRGLLTPAQLAAIEAASPVAYYRPVLFVRIGLFVATLLGVASFVLLLVITINNGFSEGGIIAFSLVVAAAATVVLELVIRSSEHYRSGVDNALLYSALLAWAVAVGIMVSKLIPNHYHDTALMGPWLWLWLVPGLLTLLLALVRYADPVVALLTFGAGLALLGHVLLQVPIGLLLLPFVVMLAAAGLHAWLRTLAARADYPYYRSSLLVLRTLALAAIYLAGNYFVMREGNAALHGGNGPSEQIPLAPLFYVLTAVVPVAYIVLGLRRHDRLLLLLGLLAVAFSLFTLRYYHSVLPPAVAATAGGAVLLALALGALRYLRTPRHGFAAADETEPPHFNLESFIVAQTAHVPAAVEPGFEFGGGHSGGGGAEGQF
ncbi:hypothetical protein QMK33_07425 [Hymenobacter sp. H14-R3]|uniref:hypothetical protein n=1 Tax=Hymenobacter sp. H14-R3 TaxID=3046308 RepID=UPI0024B91487|nr:hypothetical protein [Hymenobacter sp. H14-R3]MDJ0364979.1 hypothetical protein [Hymenobacter sp. H14-R3]